MIRATSRRPNPRRRSRHVQAALLAAAGAIVLIAQTWVALSPAGATALAVCGNPGPAPSQPEHVIVVMMENQSYRQVVGSANAPFQTGLAAQCGLATSAFGATHTSAANYLALSAGEYPAKATPGCGTVKACADASDNLYAQLTHAGSTWGAYEESMPTPCDPTSFGTNTAAHNLYSNGHNPPIFYPTISAADCRAHDLGVADLTAQSGALWNDLQNQTMPSFSFVTPNAADDGEGPGTPAQAQRTGDTWLQHFVGTVSQSASYQAGNTLLLVDYDEGTGPDSTAGEDCTNPSLDLPVVNGISTNRDSCHVPLFVVYPYTPAGDHESTFFDSYSITRTVEELFGLPLLAHAGDVRTTSLLGSFGIPSSPAPVPPPPPIRTGPVPAATSSCDYLSCSFDGSTSTDDAGATMSYAWTFGDGATGTGVNASHTYDTPGTYAYTLSVSDDQGMTSADSFHGSVTVISPPATPPPAPAPDPIAFRGAAHSYANGATTKSGATIKSPTSIVAGDVELLFVSDATAGATADPAGWTPVAQQTANPLQSTVYERTATAADRGSSVTVPVTTSTKVALQLVVYGNAAPSVVATGAVDSARSTHVAPAATVAVNSSWVVNYWADRSSTTTGWTLPAAVTSRDVVVGQGGGHPAAAVADSGGAVPSGSYPADPAQVTGGASGRGAAISLVLMPAG